MKSVVIVQNRLQMKYFCKSIELHIINAKDQGSTLLLQIVFSRHGILLTYFLHTFVLTTEVDRKRSLRVWDKKVLVLWDFLLLLEYNYLVLNIESLHNASFNSMLATTHK